MSTRIDTLKCGRERTSVSISIALLCYRTKFSVRHTSLKRAKMKRKRKKWWSQVTNVEKNVLIAYEEQMIIDSDI